MKRKSVIAITLCTVLASGVDDGPAAYAQDAPVDNRHPSWSPDGRIAFSSDRDGNDEVYIAAADGTGLTRLTNDPGTDYPPYWSPDGTRGTFMSDRSGDFEIYRIRADGSGLTRLTHNPGADWDASWSPDGSTLVFMSSPDGNREIFTMRPDGTGQRPLTHDDAHDHSPAWSPAGDRIAFSSNRDGDADIHLVNPDGTGVVNLARVDGFDGAPAWSPDGRRIAFHSDRDGDYDIYVMNADGSGVVRLTDDGASDTYPSWSPDGTRIAFESDRDGHRDVYVMDADGSDVRPLLRRPGEARRNHGAREHARAPAGGEEVFFRNGELDLAGLWFVPPGDGPFPAAVILRGSGESRRDSPWARLFVDLLLENGVAVLLSDKRGSGASRGDWRTATFSDLADDALAAVAYVRTRPDVDPGRVGLVGLSQGGRVAPVAAARSRDVAFVVDVVGSAVPFAEQIRHEMAHTFREAGLAGRDYDAAMRLHRLGEAYVRREVPWDSYRAELDRALESRWSRVARDFPRTRDDWRWKFFRGVVDFDPLPHWRRVEAPTLILYGSEDTNTPAGRSVERLEEAFSVGGPERYEFGVFDGLDHGLLAPMEGGSHRIWLHPDVRRTLTDWLQATLF